MPHEMTRDEMFKALGEFHDLGMRQTNLDGGDPLMHRHIDEIVDWLTQRGVTVSMHTNGTLVPRKIDTVQKLARVKISLDGPREHHDAMRGAGSFQKAITGAKAAQDAGVQVEFTCTVGRHNADAIDSLIEMAEDLQIPVVFQPALNSLFLDTERDGSSWQLDSHLNVSVDGVKRNSTTVKVLETLRTRLELLAQRAQFRVVLSAVIGSAPREEVLHVVDFATSHGFSPRILLIHDEHGQIGLSPEQLAVYADVKRRLGRAAKEAHDYRDRLIHEGEAPFRCRSGARYLYIDEFGMVRWCAQTRTSFGKRLLEYTIDDLREQFYTGKSCHATCSVGCARTVSAYDEWRVQWPPRANNTRESHPATSGARSVPR